MTRGATTRRLQFLPYRYDPAGLVLSIDRCVLDDSRDVGPAYDADHHIVDLSGYRFDTVGISLTVEVAEGVGKSVFPADESSPMVADLLVLVQCRATRLRSSCLIVAGAVGEGRHAGDLVLRRDDVVGWVELTPVLLRNADRSLALDEFASSRGSRVAAGLPITVRFEAMREPTGEYLDIRYESFREKGPPQFPRAEAIYHLECEGEHPILWLNSDHEQVCPVLDDAATVGRMARLRDVLFDQISYSVWLRLFVRAARAYSSLGEAAFPWQEAVLARLLPLVYPETPDHESRLDTLQRDFHHGNEDDVLDRLDGGLQEYLDLGRHATALTEELS